MSWIRLAMLGVICLPMQAFAARGYAQRGVDFRVSFDTSNLSYYSAGAADATFIGHGVTLMANIYLMENEHTRFSFFTGTRFINYGDTYLSGSSANGIQENGITPGFEFNFFGLFVQLSYPILNLNEYLISATPITKALTVQGPAMSAGLGAKFGKLGISLSVTKMEVVVPASALGTATDGYYRELMGSLTFVYFLEEQPSRFFKTLF